MCSSEVCWKLLFHSQLMNNKTLPFYKLPENMIIQNRVFGMLAGLWVLIRTEHLLTFEVSYEDGEPTLQLKLIHIAVMNSGLNSREIFLTLINVFPQTDT